MLAVGLTGDVGAGKSTLCSIWAGEGANVINADTIVADLWEREDMISLATSRWGKGILSKTGRPDHAIIAGIIFENEFEYRWVCDTFHPHVRMIMKETAARMGGWVVAEIPLLFENGVPEWIDLTVYLEASPLKRLSRNRHRGWGVEEIKRRELRLMPTREKKRLADFILCNDGDIPKLADQARHFARGFRAASRAIWISVPVSSPEEASRLERCLKSISLASEETFFTEDNAVSAIVMEEVLEGAMVVKEEFGPGKLSCAVIEKTRQIPKDILLRIMEGATS
jgi:dephospho-CoA kinase